jgi:hypothetical protein
MKQLREHFFNQINEKLDKFRLQVDGICLENLFQAITTSLTIGIQNTKISQNFQFLFKNGKVEDRKTETKFK